MAVSAAQTLNVTKGILSVTSPGPAVAGAGAEGRKLARACNDELYGLLKTGGRNMFAMYGSLPDWTDTEGTLAEIDYALYTLKVPGFIVMSSYSGR